jgi:hypothetical protein
MKVQKLLMQFDSPCAFLSSILRNSLKSKYAYECALAHFQRYLVTSCKEYNVETILEPLSRNEINVYILLDKFVSYLLNLNTNLTPNSINLYVAAIRSYLAYHRCYVLMANKINQIVGIPGEEKSNCGYSPSIKSDHHAVEIANNISSTSTMNPCHTVTHVIHDIHVSSGCFSNEGLDFIISHLQEPMWPRTISTKATYGRQVTVNSREEALAYFKAANHLDCRINAYPYWRPSTLSDFIGVKNTIPPSLLMIDLDLSDFNGEANIIKAALRKILRRISQLLSSIPTVIWSGNGYHIYVPIRAVVLEDIKEFTNIGQISTKFLRFAEWYLSSGKSDHAHNSTVSLNNCMLRIPGTYNSKNNTMVEIIQEWDNNRPRITLLLGSFCAYHKDQQLKEKRFLQQNAAESTSFTTESIPWIERLSQTAIPNGRKYCIWRILVPYLVNRKRLSAEQSTIMILDWLHRCSQLARLDFNPHYRINYAIRHVGKHGPVYAAAIEKEHDTLHDLLKVNGVL